MHVGNNQCPSIVPHYATHIKFQYFLTNRVVGSCQIIQTSFIVTDTYLCSLENIEENTQTIGRDQSLIRYFTEGMRKGKKSKTKKPRGNVSVVNWSTVPTKHLFRNTVKRILLLAFRVLVGLSQLLVLWRPIKLIELVEEEFGLA